MDKKGQERAERLRAIRERIHRIASQRQFAAVLGVEYPRYNHWENGLPIPAEAAKAIKDITPGVTGDYILWGDTSGLTAEALRLLTDRSPVRLVRRGPPKK